MTTPFTPTITSRQRNVIADVTGDTGGTVSDLQPFEQHPQLVSDGLHQRIVVSARTLALARDAGSLTVGPVARKIATVVAVERTGHPYPTTALYYGEMLKRAYAYRSK